MLKRKIEHFGTPKVALEIFSEFAGNKQLTDPNAELEANKNIEKSLSAYGKNIFAIRVEMPSGDIIWQNGMYNVLSREDIKRFDQFQACVHPYYLAGYNFWSNCLFEVIEMNNFDFNNLVFHIRVPLKNLETGQYHWYNQHSISLIADTKGNVLSFLSIYTYDSICYEGNPIIMLPSISDKNKISYLDKVLKSFGGKRLLQNNFTPMEQSILDCYINNINPRIRFRNIGNVYEHNTNIIKKAKSIFQYRFSDAKSVGKYLQSNNMW
jgi:hypothetical protein